MTRNPRARCQRSIRQLVICLIALIIAVSCPACSADERAETDLTPTPGGTGQGRGRVPQPVTSDDPEKHNYRVISDDPDWEVEEWMSGSLIRPGRKMQMTFRFVRKGSANLEQMPRVHVDILMQATDDPEVSYQSSFDEVTKEDPDRVQTWTLSLDNLFPGGKTIKGPGAVVREGYYAIDVVIQINDTCRYHFNGLPVEILDPKR
jgi:hypothetical protein